MYTEGIPQIQIMLKFAKNSVNASKPCNNLQTFKTIYKISESFLAWFPTFHSKLLWRGSVCSWYFKIYVYAKQKGTLAIYNQPLGILSLCEFMSRLSKDKDLQISKR
jgi:hypothetical protein